jgi:hypothetical protein
MLSSKNWILWLFYIPFISILIANYFKHTIYKPSTEAQTAESWMNYVYIGGFIWLLITQWGITYLLLPAPERINWLVVIITIIVSLGIGIALIYYPTVVKSSLAKFPHFLQISPPPQTNLQRARRGVKLFSRLLESESGLLWAILITLFIVSVLLQIGGGTP